VRPLSSNSKLIVAFAVHKLHICARGLALHELIFMENPELVLFKNALRRLQPLMSDMVFAGGCATAAYFTDPQFKRPAPAQWLDVIVRASNESGGEWAYSNLAVKFKELGMREDIGAGIGRWKMGNTSICLQGTEAGLSPLSSRFVSQAYIAPRSVALIAEGKTKVVTPVYLLALKLEHVLSLGPEGFVQFDAMSDLAALLAGRPELEYDLRLAAPALRNFVQKALVQLKPKSEFQHALSLQLGHDAWWLASAIRRMNELVRINLAAA
jgi:hypothetical protein